MYQKKYVHNNNIHSIFNKVEFLIWNRDYSNLNRPKLYKNYHLYFVHGHDGTENTKDNVYNLDNNNELGKCLAGNFGTLNIFEFKNQS